MRYLFYVCALACSMLVFQDADAACGTRGGPGYRSPSGKCVSWQEIGRVCGSPPSTHCTPEKVAEDAEAGAGLGKKIQELKERAHGAQ
jgi:hypothetical protein